MHPCDRSSAMGFTTSVLAVLLAAFLLPSRALGLDNGQCFDCHGDQGILTWSEEEKASNVVAGGPKKAPPSVSPFPDITLHVDSDRYKASVHADLSCTDCHKDIKAVPHAQRLAPVECKECHAEVEKVYAGSRHQTDLAKKHVPLGPHCADCHGAHYVPKSSSSASPVYYRNISATCTRCHGSAAVALAAGIHIPGAAKMYEKSVHNRAIVEKGLNKAASCVDCHGSHDLRDRLDPASPIYRRNIPATCGKCHYGAFTLFKDSVHGTTFYRGVPDAPGCTDCHGEHEIREARDPKSSVYSATISEKTCPSCHAAEKLAARYGIPTEKVRGYQESFHGLSQRLGDKTVANCSSCHGYHEIFPSEDPRSTTNPRNLPLTCGKPKCHPGATENFAKGNIHVGAGGTGGQVKMWVQRVYIWLIVGVIGGMLVHNAADYFRKMQEVYRKRKEWDHPGYERLNRSERIQHILTLTTFFALVITGFALKFKWSIPLLSDDANVWIRGTGHRIAAVLMVATSFYHIYYALFTARGRGHVLEMMPRLKDIEDIVGTLKYFAGIEGHKPKFERFSYVEKAEYLALVWGTIVMVVTGFLLWFQDEALRHLPMWGLDVATLVHYYEAILATLAIIVWHLYYVFINPDFAPMSFTWIDGKLSRKLMEHEHALELSKIDEHERLGLPPDPKLTQTATEEK